MPVGNAGEGWGGGEGLGRRGPCGQLLPLPPPPRLGLGSGASPRGGCSGVPGGVRAPLRGWQGACQQCAGGTAPGRPHLPSCQVSTPPVPLHLHSAPPLCLVRALRQTS